MHPSSPEVLRKIVDEEEVGELVHYKAKATLRGWKRDCRMMLYKTWWLNGMAVRCN